MNKRCLPLMFLLLFCSWTSFLFSQTTFQANLAGMNEVLPITNTGSGSIGSGSVTAVLTDSTLVVSGSFQGLSAAVDTSIAGGSHIHRGYAGQNGPIMFPLTATLDSAMTGGTYEAASNTFTLSAAQVQALMDRRFYVNIHTLNYPGGEIRGQLLAEVETTFATNLFGSAENPPVLSGGSGALALELDGTTLTVTGSFQNLDGDFDATIGGGSHLHIGYAGSNGGISVALNATVDADLKGGVYEAANNSFTLDSAQADALFGRRMYANIHTTLYPSGELRGQVVGGTTLAVYRAHLSGSNEVPVVTTRANGAILLEVLNDSMVQASGSFHDLGSALATAIGGGSHIHTGMAGRTGPVIFPLTVEADSASLNGTYDPESNMFTLSADQMAALNARGLYANIHSQNHLPGEIRGQILPEGQSVFNAFLSSAYEVPEAFSGALGDLKAELSGNTLTVSGSFNDLGAPLATSVAGGAHLHLGLAGTTGGIVFPLASTLDADSLGGVFAAADNVFTLDSAQVEDLKARRYYANVHSTSHPSGELRGQLLHQATTYFAAPLSGTSEPAIVNSTGRGMVMVEISGTTAYLSGSFHDLTSTYNGGAHIHEAIAGRNGGVVFPLSPTANTDSLGGQFQVADHVLTLTSGDVDTMIMRLNYVNIHTVEYPGGEIRGQLLPLATHYFTTTLQGINEVQPNSSAANGGMKFEITGDVLTVSGSFDNLESDFNTAVAGGAHIHLAMAGMNGGIAFPLTTTLDADNRGGLFLAENNVFVLDSAQASALGLGNLYANVHTLDFPGGEVRGQVLKETNSFPTDETNITSPASGAVVTIEGNPADLLTATWMSGFEPDANKLVYIWQLAADSSFTNIVFQQNTVTDTFISLPYGDVDVVLDSAGLAVGDSIMLWHRALGSDGAVYGIGDSAKITLIRGDFMVQQGVDLELSISANVVNYAQYVDVTYTITIVNMGTDTATNVSVAAGLPAGMVHTFNFTNKGTYNLFFERWDVGTLAPGETGTLSLVLFPLVTDSVIQNFVQVISQDQTDVDSAPNNGTCCTANEDDEAVVEVFGPTPPQMGGVTADLELFASVDSSEYEIYVDVFYHLTLVNNGPDDAAGINVRAGLPAGMVHTSNFATHGQYNLFFQRWEVGFLAAGDTARLDLTLFPLTTGADLTNFFEVLTSDQDDPDSTPGNGVCCTPNEDDEAVVTVIPSPFNSDDPQQRLAGGITPTIGEAVVFPNPTSVEIKVQVVSLDDVTAAQIVILDQTGRLVLAQDTDLWKGFNEWVFDVSKLTSGVYFVKVPGASPLRFVKM